MSEESRVHADLLEEIAHLKQAREKLARATNQHNISRERVALLKARLIHLRTKGWPFHARLPRITSGRARDDAERQRRRVHHRMIYLELLRRKDETGKPIINHYGPSLVEDMAAEIHLSEAAIRRSWKIGKTLDDVEVS